MAVDLTSQQVAALFILQFCLFKRKLKLVLFCVNCFTQRVILNDFFFKSPNSSQSSKDKEMETLKFRISASQVVLAIKNPPANAGDIRDTDSIPGLEDPWRRKWQPTPVFLPGESHGQGSLAGYSPWGQEESDTTKRLAHRQTIALRFTVFSKTDLYGDDFWRSQLSFECMSSIFFFFLFFQ